MLMLKRIKKVSRRLAYAGVDVSAYKKRGSAAFRRDYCAAKIYECVYRKIEYELNLLSRGHDRCISKDKSNLNLI